MRGPNSFAHSQHRRVLCLFLTTIVSLGSGTTSRALPVPARSTESFVNSIGIVMHIAYNTVGGVAATSSSIFRDLGQLISAGTVYFSYYTRRETDSPRTLSFGLFSGTTEKLSVAQNGNTSGTSSGAFSTVFLNNAATLATGSPAVSYATGVTHLVVVRVDFNASGLNERVRVYLNPSQLESETQLIPYLNSITTDLGTIDRVRFFAGGTQTGFSLPSTGSFDELRVGITFRSVLPLPATLIESWRFANFGDTTNQGNGCDDNDADADGMTNLMEYALSLNPKVADHTFPPFLDTSTGYLSIEFPRHSGRTDLTYNVRASDNLLSWTTIASSSGGAPFVASGARSIVETGEDVIVPVTVEDSFEILSNPQRFLCLEITR